jgi:DNA modification methylase
MSSGSVDLVIGDPPYFKTVGEKWDFKWRTDADYLDWSESWINKVSRVSKPTATFCLFGYFRTLCLLVPVVERAGFELRQQIIINKGIRSVSGRKTSTYKMFPTTTESILIFIKDNKPDVREFLKKRQADKGLTAKDINERLGVDPFGGGMWSLYTGDNILAQLPTEESWQKLQDILGFDIDFKEISHVFNKIPGLTDVWDDIDFYKEKRVHRAQKPIKLIDRLVTAYSNEGDVVLDPFSGSGTSAVVCRSLGRHFICFENDERYHEISMDRLRTAFLTRTETL